MENSIQFFLPRMRDLKQKIIYHQPEPLVHQCSNLILWKKTRDTNHLLGYGLETMFLK